MQRPIDSLRSIRDSIRATIETKGVTLPPGSPMSAYPQAVAAIQTGDGDNLALDALIARTTTTVESHVSQIGLSAFRECVTLLTAIFPDAETIGGYAFLGCTNLTVVSFPKARTIGALAFQNCRALAEIVLPQAETISASSFSNCSALTALVLPGSSVAALQNANAFTGTTCQVYVPDDLVAAYQAATNWADLTSRIRPLSERP